PPADRRSAHELQVLRREDHGREFSEVIRQSGDTRLVAPQLLAVMVQLDREMRLALPLVLEDARDRRGVLRVADEQLLLRRAERTQSRDEARRLEQAGFPLRVRAEQKMPATGKLERGE